jgi:putative endopeptidase
MKTKKDFYLQINKQWIKTQKIPKNETSINSFTLLDNKIKRQLLHIFDRSTPIYKSCLYTDEDKVVTQIHCVSQQLIGSGRDINQLVHLSMRYSVSLPFQIYLANDLKTSSKISMYVSETPLSLSPDDMKTFKKEYLLFLKKFETFGVNPQIVWDIEHSLSQCAHKPEENHFEKVYNPYTPANFRKEFPDLDSTKLCDRKSLIVVVENSKHFRQCLKWMVSENEKFRSFLIYQTIIYYSFFHKGLRDILFDFFGKKVMGILKAENHSSNCIRTLQGSIFKVKTNVEYLRLHRNTKEIEMCMDMCKKIVHHLILRIESNQHLHKSTIASAIRKIRKVRFVIGSSESFEKNPYLGNISKDLFQVIEEYNEFSIHKMFTKQSTDITKVWDFSKMGNVYDVNAYYIAGDNAVVIPNGILQPPFFDKKKSLAYNLAYLGTTIGHELFHAIDEEGCKYDEDGNYKNWWLKSDKDSYKREQLHIVKQYEEYAWQTDKIKINGRLSLGENIADIGGLIVAEMVLEAECEKTSLDKLLKEFFLAYAQQWKMKQTKKDMMRKKSLDVHALYRYRTNCVLAHSKHFQRLFPEMVSKTHKFFW